jgi:hypothetical protein
MIAIYITSLVLMGLSGFLLDVHRRSWRAALADSSLTDRDRRFARSQYRRRNQASAMIGVMGAAVAVKPLVPAEPWPLLIYMGTLTGACVCIMLLAALDVWATRQNYARLRSEQLAAQMKLLREMRHDDR